jgi:hypothetical protein
MSKSKTNDIADKLKKKTSMKQEIYLNTFNTFKQFKDVAQDIVRELDRNLRKNDKRILLEYKSSGDFEMEMKFGSDILVFLMHTNVFEFPRDHEVMKTPYVREDPDRSYCGVIHVYNFLADSFRYNRLGDTGYLIARIFINKDLHYFIEGKREVGQLYNNFGSTILTWEAIRSMIESAIDYCIKFDLLTPYYDDIKEVSVQDMYQYIDNQQIKTAKRMGFRFLADRE